MQSSRLNFGNYSMRRHLGNLLYIYKSTTFETGCDFVSKFSKDIQLSFKKSGWSHASTSYESEADSILKKNPPSREDFPEDVAYANDSFHNHHSHREVHHHIKGYQCFLNLI